MHLEGGGCFSPCGAADCPELILYCGVKQKDGSHHLINTFTRTAVSEDCFLHEIHFYNAESKTVVGQ